MHWAEGGAAIGAMEVAGRGNSMLTYVCLAAHLRVRRSAHTHARCAQRGVVRVGEQ